MKYNDNGIWKDLTVKVSDTLPIGTVMPFAGNTVPSDWMVCDGSAISRTVYSTLFGVIGTSFGEGDGETTFNIPDLRGEFVVNYIIKATKTVTGEYISETLPIGTELEFNGETTDIPDGWEQAANPNLFSLTDEVKTGEIWVDGRHIYRKVFIKTVDSYSSDSINLSSLGFYEAWVDHGNTFSHYSGRLTSSSAVFYANDRDYGLCYLNTEGNMTLVNQNNYPRTFFITIKYTKQADQGGNS